ncbi:MAG: hypothetical protein HQL32_03960 [Planctomycetes bacterium]|nr:hypothetical protein [Planctomycetota bacterium]
MSAMVFSLGLANLYTSLNIALLITLPFISWLTPGFRPQSFFKNLGQHIKTQKWLIICLGIYAFVTWSRTLSPTYFIDTCKYHFPICTTYLEAGGFIYLPDTYVFEAATSFFPESFYLICLALLDDFCAQTFMWAIGILVLIRLHFLLKLLIPQQSTLLPILFLAGNMIFTSNIIYSKTDPLLIYFILELLYLTLHPKRLTTNLSFGILFGFTFILKYNLVLCLPPMLFWIFYNNRKNYKQQLVALLPGLIFALLWLIKNHLTHGILLFPFILNNPELPDILLSGFKLEAEYSYGHKVKECLLALFGINASTRFTPGLFMWIVCLSLPFCRLWNKKYFFLTLGFSLAFWLINVYILPQYVTSTRITFPIWCLGCLILAKALENRGVLVTSIAGLLILGQCVSTLKYVVSYLPGKNYHLGKESLGQAYTSMNNDFARLGFDLKNMDRENKVAVYSEYGHLCRHPNKVMIYWSSQYDREKWDFVDFKDKLINDQIDYLLYDKRLKENRRPFSAWVPLAVNQKFIKLEKETANAQLFSIFRDPE